MQSYLCKYGLYHHKPCVNSKPSSNNGWIYTAYANRLDFNISRHKLRKVFLDCTNSLTPLDIDRLPGKKEPPLSRDEVIGMVSLGFLTVQYLDYNDYRYKYSDLKVPLYRQVKALWSLKDQHRNYVWKNNISDAYPVVFKLAAHDRYYVKAYNGYETTIFETLMFYLYVITTLLGKKPGNKNILWLQLTDLNHSASILINQEKNFLEYFGEEHVFNNKTCGYCVKACNNDHCITKENE